MWSLERLCALVVEGGFWLAWQVLRLQKRRGGDGGERDDGKDRYFAIGMIEEVGKAETGEGETGGEGFWKEEVQRLGVSVVFCVWVPWYYLDAGIHPSSCSTTSPFPNKSSLSHLVHLLLALDQVSELCPGSHGSLSASRWRRLGLRQELMDGLWPPTTHYLWHGFPLSWSGQLANSAVQKELGRLTRNYLQALPVEDSIAVLRSGLDTCEVTGGYPTYVMWI